MLALRHAGGLLAVSITVRGLDGGGLLPGVHESHKVQVAAQDPRILFLWLPIALVAGLAAATVSRQRSGSRVPSGFARWALTGVAFPAMFGVSEAAAHAGAPMKWDELGWPVVLQVAIAVVLVFVGWSVSQGLAVATRHCYLRPDERSTTLLLRAGNTDRTPLATRGRGPPRRVMRTTPTLT